MSKRGPQSEINADNWDKEDEAEEAGEFKKATEDQLKGRVMKKAKRRNLTEDQKKNIFSGFGGFTSTNQSAEEAFSFLGKSKDTSSEDKESQNKGIFGSEQGKDTKSNTGFVFGGNKDSNGSNSIFGGFTFGNGIKKIEENTKNETKEEDSKKDSEEKDSKDISKDDDLFSKFKPKSGSWSCSVCMISNDSTKSKCLACETPKPSTNPSKSSEPSPAPKSDDLMDKFKAKAGSWSCGVCMISNSADKSKCAACETPNPKALASKPDDLMAKFMTKSDKWTCDTCMISNPADKTKCVACETSKPGATKLAEEPAKPSFSFGSTGGFQFLDKSTTSQSNSAFANFKFGASQPTTTDTSGGFKFGSSSGETSSESKKETSGGFKFGSNTEAASTESKKETLGGFRFGSSTKEETAETKKESLGGFTFGSVKTNPPVSQPEGGGGFKFGSSETISSPPGQIKDFAIPAVKDKEAVVPDTPKTKTRRNEYLASLKALNMQVTNWIKSHVDDNPLVDLSPVFKDYEKHLQGLRTKYDIKSPGQKPVSEETKTDKPFPAFGNEFKSSNNSGFSFGFLNNGKKEEVSKNDNSDDGEVAITKDKVEAVVEEDSLYSKKCKLFYKKDDAFTERGLGNVHLKVTEEKKVQLIVRADTSLGNILLNILITDTIPVERMGKNNLMIICLPNPPIDPKADLVPTTFLLRVKTGEDADELKDKLQELVKENWQ